MAFRLLAVLAAGTALAACGGAKSVANGQNTANAQAVAPANAAAPASANASGAAQPANGVETAYTDVDLARCQALSDGEVADSMAWRCPGLGDTPLFIAIGDLRYDVDAGVDNENFETLPPFNENPARIEWRVRGGRPFAIIYRLTLATNEQTEWSGSALGIDTVGAPGRPGCTIAWVDGNVPDANAVARRIADQSAAGPCSGEPRMIHRGNVPAG